MRVDALKDINVHNKWRKKSHKNCYFKIYVAVSYAL